MSVLRRRTSTVLSLLLVSCLVAGLAGAIFVVAREPLAAIWLTGVATLLAGATIRALDEGWRVFDVLAVVYTLFALGLYALHLLGLSRHAVWTIAAALAGLVVAMLVRGLIAASSADNPYDD